MMIHIGHKYLAPSGIKLALSTDKHEKITNSILPTWLSNI